MAKKLKEFSIFGGKKYKRGNIYYSNKEDAIKKAKKLKTTGINVVRDKNSKGHFLWIHSGSAKPKYVKKSVSVLEKKKVESHKKFNFAVLSKKYLKKYSKDEDIPENYFRLSEKRTNKFIQNVQGDDTYAVKKGRWITINPRVFEVVAEENLKDAKKMLSFVMAHEVSHYKSKMEVVADIKATLHSHISVIEFNILDQKYQKKLRKFRHK